MEQNQFDPKQTPFYQQGFKDGKKKQKKKSAIICIILIIVAFSLGNFWGGVDTPTDTPTEKVNTTNKSERNTTEPATTEMSKKDYKSACEKFNFAEVVRNPDKFKGNLYKVEGEVIQVQETSVLFSDDTSLTLRVNVTKNTYGYEDTIYVTYTLPSGADRILEDDIITIYGECEGTETYTSVLGNSVTLPSINAKYIEIN